MILQWLIRDLLPGVRYHYKNRMSGEFLNPALRKQYHSRPAPAPLAANLKDFRYALIEQAPLPVLLHHEDRNSMAFSIEARLPLLDYRLADFIFNLLPETLMEAGWSKVFLRRYLDKAEMSEVAWRREKMGYSMPTAALMEQSRSFFQDVCKGALHSERFIDSRRLRRLLNEEKFSDWHWRLLSVELWMQRLGVK
jgi:asparagine synthase (glutamine-hydrolysing)